MNTKGIVLAGGAGSGAVGVAQAKVANRPIAWHVLDSLAAAGIEESYVVGPRPELDEVRQAVEREDPIEAEITYLPGAHGRTLAETLRPTAPFIGDAGCIVHSADGLLGQPVGPLLSLLRPDHPDLVLLLNDSVDGFEQLDERFLLGLTEITGFDSPAALAGAFLLGPGALELACARDDAREGDGSFAAVVERLASRGGRLQAGPISWQRYDGRPSALLEMNRMILDQLPAQPRLPDRMDTHVEGRVLIHPSAEINSSTIVGPVVIGARARIDNAYIGPYTSIGSDVEIMGAEVSRSIVLENSRIMNVRERIECSTIGRGVTISRDFGLPRALRLHVSDGDELKLD